MAKEYGIGFLEEVKVVFHGKMGEYDEFIKDIYDFKTSMNDDHRIIILPIQEFKERMNKVLKGHKHLILGFNAYMKHLINLPIPLDDNDEQWDHKTG